MTVILASKNLKKCPKCSEAMALLWRDKKKSENTYAPDKMHFLMCVQCGYGRSERFVDLKNYPLLIVESENGGLKVIDNHEEDELIRVMDPTTIGAVE